MCLSKKIFFYILNPGHCSISAHGLRHALRQNFKKYKCLKSLKLQICKTTKMRKLQICKPKVENCKSANQKAENCKFANQQKNKTTNLQIRKVWKLQICKPENVPPGLSSWQSISRFCSARFWLSITISEAIWINANNKSPHCWWAASIFTSTLDNHRNMQPHSPCLKTKKSVN